MNSTEFEVICRIDRPCMRIIRVKAENPDRQAAIYLDIVTGEPMYPIFMEMPIPGITVTLESGAAASCSLPPSLPESMVDMFVKHLKSVHGDVLALQELIKKEQQLMKQGKQPDKIEGSCHA